MTDDERRHPTVDHPLNALVTALIVTAMMVHATVPFDIKTAWRTPQ